MAISLQFFSDAQLASPLASSVLSLDREIGAAPVDRVVYLGSTVAGRLFAAADGGPISVSLVDTVPDNGGFVASDFVLAASQAGLDAVDASATLLINGGIISGVNNAVPIWLRFKGTSATPKTSTDLQLITNPIQETSA